MFKTAASKIAHNSTLPSLGGNKDLRALQDLINAEKSVLSSIQKLSVDFTKAAEALRTWGIGEGEDLGDTLGASTVLLNHYANALSQYATHEQMIREHLKAIRTREENLDELKRRRKAVVSKADAVEKKLSRMSPEHKNLAIQTDTLNKYREEIRSMDSEIMVEEAALGDFKRSKTRELLGLKFGGLLESCEKGTIAGEFGKIVVMEIPNETTLPGLTRSMYVGHQNVYALIQEAQHCISEIGFSTVPPAEPRAAARPAPPMDAAPRLSEQYAPLPEPSGSPYTPTRAGGEFGEVHDYPSSPHKDNAPSSGHFMEPSDFSNFTTFTNSSSIAPGPSSPITPSHLPPPAPQIEEAVPSRSMDDFGVGMTGSPRNVGNDPNLPGGGRFATFPVKTNNGGVGYQLRDGPPMLSGNDGDDSFSSSIAAALNEKTGRPSTDDPAPPYNDGHDVLAPSNYPSSSMEHPTGAGHRRADDDGSDDEFGLAYDAPDSHFSHKREDSDAHGKHVRFGQVSDMDSELDRRYEAEHQAPKEPSPTDGSGKSPSKRVPPPRFSPEEEERELNAAAAREISRELDALNFTAHGSVRGGRVPEDTAGSPTRLGNVQQSFGPPSPTSPLVPPSAPFANRGPSPRPESVPSSPISPPAPNPGQSPLAQVLPLRIGRSSSPVQEPSASPISPKAPLPVTPMAPPSINLPDHRSNSSFSSLRGASPYSTPPEYPRPLGARSNSSLVGGDRDRSPAASPVLPAPGARTISAAAFRRPNRTGSDAPGDKKRLPSSPYPPQRTNGGSAGNTAEEDFDYISAYTGPDGGTPALGSPLRTDYGSLGNVRVTNSESSLPPGAAPPNPDGNPGGYADGRFATNLESDLR